MENKTLEVLYARKSVRAYEDRPIPEEDVRRILNAAVQAPSAGNMALWTIIRVTDEEKKRRLAVTCDNQPFIAKAPLVLVFCADYKRWFDAFSALDLGGEALRRPGEGDLMLAAVDTVIAAHASVVAADALGYGSCHIGDILEHCEEQREILGLPEYVTPICMAVYGVPTQQQIERKKPARFDLDELVHENAYRDVGAQGMRKMLERRQSLSGEAFDRWMLAFCKRKWNSAFSEEMTRSTKASIDAWVRGRAVPAPTSEEA